MTELGESVAAVTTASFEKAESNSVQPYLAEIEKKWIAFQLLTCLRDTRVNKVRSTTATICTRLLIE